jgi:catalytic LigB subunit of aromatic ring-opening dioxygenase
MGEFVWSAATAHTGAMMREAPRDTEDGRRAERVFEAFRTLGATLRAARPEVIVTIATDHFQTFDYESLPIFAIGTGDRFEGWGEFGVPKRDYCGIAPFGAAVHSGLVEAGFDPVGARDMKLDHSYSCPLQLLLAGWDAPVLPVYVNCTIEPLPSIARCRDFGVALGDVIRRQTAVERVAILGTGGLSHSVGTPWTGTINCKFDRTFLNLFSAGRIDEIAQWDSHEVINSAGNGAAEIRNWLIAAAAARATAARVLAYEPVEAWVTGIGVTELVS